MSSVAEVDTSAPELTIERDFAHPPEAVFRACTESEALCQWMGPGDVKCPEARMDAREGGEYVFPMITPDGQTPTVRGTILEIVPNERLKFSWSWDQEDGSPGQYMEVTLEFHAQGEGTRMVLHQVNFIDTEARDKHAMGWTGSFDKLGAYLGG